MSAPIRVVLAEDQAMVLGALSALLELEPDISVVACAANGREALDAVRPRHEHEQAMGVLGPEQRDVRGERLAHRPLAARILERLERGTGSLVAGRPSPPGRD